MKQYLPWWAWALYAALLPWALAMAWLWVNLGHWPAWYTYPMAVVVWLLIGVGLFINVIRRPTAR